MALGVVEVRFHIGVFLFEGKGETWPFRGASHSQEYTIVMMILRNPCSVCCM